MRASIITLFGPYPKLEYNSHLGPRLTCPSQPYAILDDVNSDSVLRESGTENEWSAITGGESCDCGAEHIGSQGSASQPHSLRTILTTLASRMKSPKVSEHEVDAAPLRSGSSRMPDCTERINSAIRKWSTEYERSSPPSEEVVVTVTPPNQEFEVDAPINTTDQASRFTIPESPKPVEQNSATGSTEEELNGSEYHEAAPEEEPKTCYPEDYYEILQISRSADLETIHRVYRMMAFRFHPDNTKTGNLERFLLLKQAYLVLSDPLQRAAYDAASPAPDTRPLPLFESKEFLYGVRGEMNRRLGVLSLLYHKRRLGEGTCGISVLDLEKRMAFPREYLTFTLWYLRSRGYITVEDNSDYALTGDGVDFVEANGLRNDAIRQLLTAGTGTETSSAQMSVDVAGGTSAPTPVASWPKSQMASRNERHHAWRRANGRWRRRGRGGQSSDAVGTRNCHLDS